MGANKGETQGKGRLRTRGVLLLVVLLGMGVAVILFFLAPADWASGAGSWRDQGLAQFSISHLSVFLALMPSLLAFGYYVFGSQRQPDARREKQTLVRYLRFRHDLASSLSEGRPFFIEADVDAAEEEDTAERRGREGRLLEAYQEKPWEYFFSVILLALPFLALAALSDATTHNSGVFVPALREQGADPGAAMEHIGEGIRGIVFTGYGVFTYTIVVLIHRIHASALSTEFLLSATLRATLMMVIGFAIGLTGIFYEEHTEQTSGPGLFMYFAVGAFPAWGYEFIRRKAREVLFPEATRTNNSLSLEQVEGMDEATIERLEEVNISNVQHLSTADPVELTLKTLYPFHRVIDWIDQAILITYLREGIDVARRLGIRGAIDMRVTYILATSNAQPAESRGAVGAELEERSRDPCVVARKTLERLTAEAKLSHEAVYTIGTNLVNDFYVQLLGKLWHHYGVGEPSLRQSVINAIHGVMMDRDKSLRCKPGRIPEGECKVSLDEAFDKQLLKELAQLEVRWEGRARDIKRKRWNREVYDAILRDIEVKGPHADALKAMQGAARASPPEAGGGPKPGTAREGWSGRFRRKVRRAFRPARRFA